MKGKNANNKKKKRSNAIARKPSAVLRISFYSVLIVWFIVVLLYRLFFRIPSKTSYLLGLIRTISWILFLCYFDFDTLNKSTENLGLQFFYAVLPFISIGFLFVSFAVMIGFRYPWIYNGVDRTIPGLENHPNIQSTIDIMDAQLSSGKTRSNFIDSFLKGK